MDSLQTVCIICQFPENLCDLTSPANEQTAEKLTDVTTIHIQANDLLPPCICYECIGTLNVVYDFLQQCRAAKQRLKGDGMMKYEDIKMTISFIKEEPLDMQEDEHLLDETDLGKYATEEDLAEGNVDIVFEEGNGGAKQNTHAKLQQRAQKYSCRNCQKSYMTRKSLKRHVKRVHARNLCVKAFSQKADLEAHHNIKSDCHNLLSNKQSSTKDASNHLDPINSKCTFCGKSFLYWTTLKRHLRIHTKEQPYECNECHRKFSRSDNLKRHQLIHLDEWPYKCDLCSKAFRQTVHLMRHKLAHSGQKKLFKCTVCKKVLRNRRYMIRHMRTIHDDGATGEASKKRNYNVHRKENHARRTEN